MKIQVVVYAINTNNSIAISAPIETEPHSVAVCAYTLYAQWSSSRVIGFELKNKDYFMMAWEAMSRVSIRFEEIKEVVDDIY